MAEVAASAPVVTLRPSRCRHPLMLTS